MRMPGGVLQARPVEHARIRRSVALIDFDGRGAIHLAGPEGREFLQGLVTSDVSRLEDGQGRSAAVLTATGKVFAMLEVFRAAPDALYALLQDDDGARVVEFLERYRFSEMVEIADLSAELSWLSLQGPAALVAAEAVCGVGDLDPHRFRALPYGDLTLRVFRFDELGIPGVHFLIRRDRGEALRAALARAAAELGGGPASVEAWHVCRVEAGIPWVGAELDETVLPMDAGLLGILDLAKGCYIGQEVVSRGIVQGRPNWGLWGLRASPGSGLLPGQELRGVERNRPLARVRSVARSPVTGELLALAFVHREAARPGPLPLRRDDGEVDVVVEQLPFLPEAASDSGGALPSAAPEPLATRETA